MAGWPFDKASITNAAHILMVVDEHQGDGAEAFQLVMPLSLASCMLAVFKDKKNMLTVEWALLHH